MTTIDTVEILGINISCVKRTDVLQIPIDWSSQNQLRTIFYANAHCMNQAIKDPTYRKSLQHANLIYADGISVVWAARWLGGCKLEKATGRDWITEFCIQAAQKKLRLFILAGNPGIAENARRNLTDQLPNLQIVGVHHGYFTEAETPDLIDNINQANPQIVFVGMGTPQQEIWLAAYRDKIEAPVCWAVGALFDYVAGVEPPVPTWLNQLNLEWLWRMLVDPLGKWRRYLVGNPLFLYRVLRQKIGKNYKD
jgi:N-acetylglucosaminyldiphosphoundecaprenol N-acetyl-beta-D-mannosaminyltransferase